MLSLMLCIVVASGAASYVRNGIWQDTLTAWADAAAQSPGKVRPHYELGLLYGKRNNQEKAFYHMRKASEIDPAFIRWAGVSTAERYRAQGLYDEAIREYRSMLQATPGRADIHNELGILYHETSLYVEAFREYREALRLDPGLSAAHSNLGLLHYIVGDVRSALAELQTAIDLDPSDPEPHVHRGVIHANAGDVDNAAREFQAALALRPNHGKARAYLEKIGGAGFVK